MRIWRLRICFKIQRRTVCASKAPWPYVTTEHAGRRFAAKTTRPAVFCSLVCLAVFAANLGLCASDENAVPPDDNQKKFVEQYVDAVNSKDIQKLKELIHPKCLAVMTETNRDYYDLLFKNEFQIAIPPDYKVKVEEFVKNPALGKLATASLPAP